MLQRLHSDLQRFLLETFHYFRILNFLRASFAVLDLHIKRNFKKLHGL